MLLFAAKDDKDKILDETYKEMEENCVKEIEATKQKLADIQAQWENEKRKTAAIALVAISLVKENVVSVVNRNIQLHVCL